MKVRGINGKFTRGTKRSREEQAAYMRAYRAAHPDKWAREASPACMLADQIRTHCVFCAETELCCLVFHHLDPKTKNKKLTRGRQMSNLPWDEFIAEIGKCIVVCRNCHAKIHEGILSTIDKAGIVWTP